MIKKLKLKIFILLLLFAAAFCLWFRSSVKQGGAESALRYATLEEPSFPLIWAESAGRRLDVMRGYVMDTDADIAADTLILLPEDRKLPLSVEGGSLTVTGLQYELRSADRSNLIERTELKDWETTERGLRFTLPIQNLLKQDEEYQLDIVLNTEERGALHYYARVGFDSTGLAPDMLALAEGFSIRNFDYNAARENTTYLEPEAGAEDTDLSSVNLKSGYDQLTYRKLSLTPTGEADLRFLEYSGSVGIVRRDFTATGEDSGGALSQFEISETFVMRKGPERIYMMDYSRSMQEVFLGAESAFSGKGVQLGISGTSALQSVESPDGSFCAFVSAGDLWLADSAGGSCIRVWSFRSGTDAGLRGGYTKHSVKILSLTDEGKLNFLVGGYMNRGKREGQVGISLLSYDRGENAVTERAFIPSVAGSEEVEADLSVLSYLSAGGMFYFKFGDGFYGLDVRSNEYIVLCDKLHEGGYAVSPSQSEIAWQEGTDPFGAERIQLMDLEKGDRKELNSGENQYLRPIGYIGKDLAVGIAERENVWKLNGTDRELPYTAVEIVDAALNSQKHYEEAGVLLTDARTENSRIHLTKLIRTGEHSFRMSGSDTIVCNHPTATDTAIQTESSEQRGLSYHLLLSHDFASGKPKVLVPGAIRYESSAELTIPTEPSRGRRYAAYGHGSYLGSYVRQGDAVNAAYEAMGYVRYGGSLCYCRAGTASIRTIRGAESAAQAVLEARSAGTATELYGANLRAVLYFVSRGVPVMGWTEDGTALLIYAYDQASVSLWQQTDGSWLKLGLQDAEELFLRGRNDFACVR